MHVDNVVNIFSYCIVVEDVLVGVTLSGAINIWSLKRNPENKVCLHVMKLSSQSRTSCMFVLREMATKYCFVRKIFQNAV